MEKECAIACLAVRYENVRPNYRFLLARNLTCLGACCEKGSSEMPCHILKLKMSLTIALLSPEINSLPKRKINVLNDGIIQFIHVSLLNYCRFLTHITV